AERTRLYLLSGSDPARCRNVARDDPRHVTAHAYQRGRHVVAHESAPKSYGESTAVPIWLLARLGTCGPPRRTAELGDHGKHRAHRLHGDCGACVAVQFASPAPAKTMPSHPGAAGVRHRCLPRIPTLRARIRRTLR
ncbi:hypothetical protein PY02_00200, partial [Staphylococcus aureus]